MSTGRRIAATLIAVVLLGSLAIFAAPRAEAQNRLCGDSVVVAFGDTMQGIANRCGVTVDAIMRANPLLPSAFFLFPGMRINIPAPPPPPQPADTFRYVVQPGDTVLGIASAYGVPIGEVYRLNPSLSANTLRVGDVIFLPNWAAPPPPQEEPTALYTVQPGDTLSSIANEFDVSRADIRRLNPDVNWFRLRVGQTIVVPDTGAPTPPPPPTSTYVVQPGDTLGSIANKFDVSRADIRNLNPDVNWFRLRIGQVIVVPNTSAPPPPPPPVNTQTYVVQPGDTLYSIARAHGMRLSEILELNPNVNPSALRAGQVIVVRGGIVPPSPPPQSSADVTVSPSSGAPGTVTRLTASGFQRNATLKVLAGSDVSSLSEFERVTTDGSGNASLNVRIPDWAAGPGKLVFAFETLDGRLRVLSPTFRVTTTPPPQPPPVTVTGTLTREGVECQAMRGDNGQLYTLAGNLPGGLRPGDRVQVVGRTQQVSTCQQGTTISVQSVTKLN